MDGSTRRPHISDELIGEYTRLNRLHFIPLRNAIVSHRFDDARQLLNQARVELEDLSVSDDLREALEYDLAFRTHNLNWHPEINGWTEADFLAAREEFSQAARTQLGDITRRRHLLTMRRFAEDEGFDEINRNDFMELLDIIPGQLALAVLYDASTWAYVHQDLELIRRAYERFLLHPPETLGQAHWQRVNLMLQLLSKKVTKRDVVETIKTLQVKPMLLEFNEKFLPACEAAGVVDDEIRELLAERTGLIEHRAMYPGAERRTKSFIKGSR